MIQRKIKNNLYIWLIQKKKEKKLKAYLLLLAKPWS